jgi:flagellar hook-associated protein 2
MIDSIVTTLGAGSGINIRQIVDQLSTAARTPAENALNRRESVNSARISTLASIGSNIDQFSAAMTALVTGGTLSSQPSVSDARFLSASTIDGSRLGSIASEIEVVALARAQTLESAVLTAATDPVGQGDLTITSGATSFTVSITAANDSLTGLATAINAANGSVRANVVTDATGSRLVLKGATGEDAAFTVSAAAGATSGLERFAFGGAVTGGMIEAQAAQDAVVLVDGVETRHATNRIDGVIPGVRMELTRVTAGETVTLGVTRAADAITTAVDDFVTAYNEVMRSIDLATANRPGETAGPARGDTAIAALRRELSRLPASQLGSVAGAPQTLADIGVKTNRDGTLSVDRTRLSSALSANAEGVEALFKPASGSSDTGLVGALKSIRDGLRGSSGPFASSNARLSSEARRIALDRDNLERRSEKYSAQLLATYTAMDRQVTAFRATQTYLEQQTRIWTRDGG